MHFTGAKSSPSILPNIVKTQKSFSSHVGSLIKTSKSVLCEIIRISVSISTTDQYHLTLRDDESDYIVHILNAKKPVYQLPLISTALLHVDLINMVYLMACVFIMS